jgi:hypothetical protein
LLDLTTGEERLLAEFGYQPSWVPGGQSVVFVRDGGTLVERNVASGEEKVIAASGKQGLSDGLEFQTPSVSASGQIAVTLRGRTRAVVLLQPEDGSQSVISKKGCQITWNADGTLLYWTDHGGPSGLQFYRSASEPLVPEVWLDIPGEYSHQYFPKLDASGEWLIMGASTGGHEHDTADYEIHLWPVGEDPASVMRITYHTGNDCWPDIYLRPAE